MIIEGWHDGECDACQSETKVTTVEHYTEHGNATHDMCRVCYTTYLGQHLAYPSQCKDKKLHMGLAAGINMILDALAALREGADN